MLPDHELLLLCRPVKDSALVGSSLLGHNMEAKALLDALV
jgi:hypothetical protein